MTETRALLPFWFSIPLFVTLVALYRKLKNFRFWKKEKKKKDAPDEQPQGNPEQEIAETGRRLESEMVPFGEQIDLYLGRLENRWNTLLPDQARKDLSTDVKALVRDRLRQTMRGRQVMLTRDSLEKLATRIIGENNALRDLNNRESLQQFIALYMVKLLLQGKF
jgi:hypothetical protein